MVERSGPWQERVAFAPGGGFAYRPGVVAVRSEVADLAAAALAEVARVDAVEAERTLDGRWSVFRGVPDPLQAVGALAERGIRGQVDHVLFSSCCCPPHPADPSAAPFYANPFYANAVGANPFYANPFYANPFYANVLPGPCCGCGGAGANPFYANPFYANPFYANADPSPAGADWMRATGRRRSSARPADPPEGVKPDPVKEPVRVTILDTGYAEKPYRPTGLNPTLVTSGGDRPDEDGDHFLDPAAGHGTFIAGIVEQLTPGCRLEVIEVLTTYGDGNEQAIANVLAALAARPEDERPHLVNLSFGGYSPMGMQMLADAIDDLHARGTVVVASAGNDGTCAPLYPAAFETVVGVAALVEDGGAAAPFTNYGPWVRACTAGVDIVSTFYEGWNGAEPAVDGEDDDDFHGWAVWSGTSFAAPRVVAALARRVGEGQTPGQAVKELVDDDKLERHPMLGAVVVL